MRVTPESKVELVKELLAQELTQRAISRQAGVARGTVRRIASGQWPNRTPPPSSDDEESRHSSGPSVRCTVCGLLVQMPCQACRARKWQAKHRKRRLAEPVPDGGEPLRLELREVERARYEIIHAEKLRGDHAKPERRWTTPRTEQKHEDQENPPDVGSPQ